MSISTKELHGNLTVPFTDELRKEFAKATKPFVKAKEVPRGVQSQMLQAIKAPEGADESAKAAAEAATLELLDHLIGVVEKVPEIHGDIRTATYGTRQLALRAHCIRNRQNNTVAAESLKVGV